MMVVKLTKKSASRTLSSVLSTYSKLETFALESNEPRFWCETGESALRRGRDFFLCSSADQEARGLLRQTHFAALVAHTKSRHDCKL